jgi:hypothetical protein
MNTNSFHRMMVPEFVYIATIYLFRKGELNEEVVRTGHVS